MMNHLPALQRVGACECEHRLVQLDSFFIVRIHVAWFNAIVRCANRIHAAVRRVAEVAIWMLAGLIVPLAGPRHLADP